MTNVGYKNYGARGIFVCDRWMDSYENFLTDMGRKPTHAYSLERVDNDKGYNLSNCIWATSKKQNNNKRNNVRYEFNGVNHTIGEWAEIVGIKYKVLKIRIASGMSIEIALTKKVIKRQLFTIEKLNKVIELLPLIKSRRQISRMTGVSTGAIKRIEERLAIN